MSKLLSPFKYSEGKEWRFRLDQDAVVQFEGRNFGNHSFHDPKGNEWLTLQGDKATVRKGYAWDGCSPKVRFLGKWHGTPDYEGTRLGSLLHDSFCQFLHCKCHPLTKKQCDELFGEVMKSQGFAVWQTYMMAVMTFGGCYSLLCRLKGSKPEGYCDV